MLVDTNVVGEILTIAGDKVITIGEDMIAVTAGAVTAIAGGGRHGERAGRLSPD